MKKLFPDMTSSPRAGEIIGIVSYWVWAFVLVPMWLPFLSDGLWEKRNYGSWLQILYYTLNFIVIVLIIKAYLKDEWFMVTTAPGYYLGHVAATAGIMVGVVILLTVIRWLLGGNVIDLLEWLPVTEMIVSQTPGLMVVTNPAFGTLCTVLLTPVCLCGLFYALGFAPLCCRKPIVAYFLVAVVVMIPSVVDVLWRGGIRDMADKYFLYLPVHLLACWSYQKTDNIFTPMFSLALLNLFGAAVNILLSLIL